MKQILKSLRSIKNKDATYSAYDIYHEVLNTNEYGIPQNRPRWYCIGIRKTSLRTSGGSKKFSFPEKQICPGIDKFLEKQKGSPQEIGGIASANIKKAEQKIREGGGDPETQPYIVDCDASANRTRSMLDM